MAIEQVREYFRKAGIEERIQEFEVSSATVELRQRHCVVSRAESQNRCRFWWMIRRS